VVAADIIQRRVEVVAVTPVAVAADAPTAEVVVTAAEVVDTRVVVVAVIPVVAEDMEVTAKKLGDATSLREAAT